MIQFRLLIAALLIGERD